MLESPGAAAPGPSISTAGAGGQCPWGPAVSGTTLADGGERRLEPLQLVVAALFQLAHAPVHVELDNLALQTCDLAADVERGDLFLEGGDLPVRVEVADLGFDLGDLLVGIEPGDLALDGRHLRLRVIRANFALDLRDLVFMPLERLAHARRV